MKNVKGLNEVQARINKHLSQLRQIRGVASNAAAVVVQEAALANLQTQSGSLFDSSAVVSNGRSGHKVVFSDPAAVRREFGTGSQEPEPFLRPALDASLSEVLSAAGGAVSEKLRVAT